MTEIERNTLETRISLRLAIDGSGIYKGTCGIPFMDHMLALFCRHGLFDLDLDASGDIEVDYHHMVEDLGIVLGEAVKQSLGEKRGIRRYGSMVLPMDETLMTCALDLSNRSFLVYKVSVETRFVRDFNIMLLREFFQGFANTAGANIHFILHHGDEPHHVAEAAFKAFAKALDAATLLDARLSDQIPSSKGVL